MEHLLNKVQQWQSFLGNMTAKAGRGVVTYTMTIEEYVLTVKLVRGFGVFHVSLHTALTDELRFTQIGKIKDIEEIDYAFESVAEIIAVFDLYI